MAKACLALLLFIEQPQSSVTAPSYEQALAAAEASTQAPGGAAYHKEFGSKSAKHVAAALNHCLPGPVATALSFDVLLKLESDGKVSSAMVKPEGDLPACVRDQMKRRKFPRPPVAGTWKAVRVRLGP